MKKVKNLIWFVPFLAVLVLDQAAKFLVVAKIDYTFYDKVNVIGDFLQFVHVRNTAAGFGIGSSMAPTLKSVFLIVIPLILVVGLLYLILNAEKYNIKTKVEKFSLTLIAAGGLGNLIDRVFEKGGKPGVVDFINVKVFGLFGLDYWPTFNIADMAVVIGVILLLVWTLIINPIKASKKSKKSNKDFKKSFDK